MPIFLNDIELNLNEIKDVVIDNVTADPSGVEGQIIYRTDTDELKYFDGSIWVTIGTGSGGATDLEGLSDVDLTDPQDGQFLRYRGSTPMWVNEGARLDELDPPQTNIDLNGQRIVDLADPVAGTDAANKNYVDSVAAGLDWKESVRAATAVAGTLATSFEAGDTIDGVVLVAGDRILIKDQSAGAENGIYVVEASGAPTRAADANTSAEVTAGLAVFVEEGTANADSGWVLTTNDPIVLDTTALVFTQFTGLGQVVAGDGLVKSGNTLHVGAGTGITVNADDVAINTSVVPLKYSEDVGDGSSTSIVVTHNLGTRDVVVGLRENSGSFNQVITDVQMTSTTTITLIFANPPTTDQYRVTILG